MLKLEMNHSKIFLAVPAVLVRIILSNYNCNGVHVEVVDFSFRIA